MGSVNSKYLLAALSGFAAVALLMAEELDGEQPTAPIRKHHQELLQHLETVWQFARTVGTGEYTAECAEAAEIAAWLLENIERHAKAEELYLYPVVAHLMGAKDATKTMSRDHDFVARYIGEIAAAVPSEGERWDPDQLMQLRAAIYRLQGLLLPHFDKEETIYLPILDKRMRAAAIRKRILEPMEEMQSDHAPIHAHDGGHGGEPVISKENSRCR